MQLHNVLLGSQTWLDGSFLGQSRSLEGQMWWGPLVCHLLLYWWSFNIMSDDVLTTSSHPPQASANQSSQEAVAPPVPRRRDSLPSPKKELRYFFHTPRVPTMSAIETVLDTPHTTYTFEAKTLWKDSFKCLYEFYQQGILCDVTIKAGKRAFPCHRVIIACCSSYFRSMFTSEMSECKQPCVTIKDIDDTALEALIMFAYTSRITLSTDNVQTLLYASSILQVEIVAQACCDFMMTHLHPSNCIGIQAFAQQHGRTDLMKCADKFILDNFSGVVESEEFLFMCHKHLETMLASPDLNVNSEIEAYEATMKWINHSREKRQHHIPRLMAHIRLPLLPPTYLMDTVAKEELLRKNFECRDFLDEAKSYQLSLAQVVPGMKPSLRMRPRKSYAGETIGHVMLPWWTLLALPFNTLRLRHDGCHFPNIFKCIFLNENVSIAIEISQKFVLKGPVNNIPALVQIMAWHRPGDKPLSELVMVSLPTHMCITRSQCVKSSHCNSFGVGAPTPLIHRLWVPDLPIQRQDYITG